MDRWRHIYAKLSPCYDIWITKKWRNPNNWKASTLNLKFSLAVVQGIWLVGSLADWLLDLTRWKVSRETTYVHRQTKIDLKAKTSYYIYNVYKIIRPLPFPEIDALLPTWLHKWSATHATNKACWVSCKQSKTHISGENISMNLKIYKFWNQCVIFQDKSPTQCWITTL